jgi:hypothetical protein
MFVLFRKAEVAVSSQDYDTLQTYLQQTKDQQDSININHLLQHFKIDEAASALLSDI